MRSSSQSLGLPVIRELQEFPETPYPEIFTSYKNLLYIYPQTVDFNAKGGNIGVRVELRLKDSYLVPALKVKP